MSIITSGEMFQCIYKYVDKSGKIIYIGSTDNLYGRMANFINNRKQDLIDLNFDKLYFTRVDLNKEERIYVEEDMIHYISPIMNKNSNFTTKFNNTDSYNLIWEEVTENHKINALRNVNESERHKYIHHKDKNIELKNKLSYLSYDESSLMYKELKLSHQSFNRFICNACEISEKNLKIIQDNIDKYITGYNPNVNYNKYANIVDYYKMKGITIHL